MQSLTDYQPSKQGDASGGWILLDYGSIIVHIMTPQMRNFYKLEKRWKDAEEVNVAEMIGDEEYNNSRVQPMKSVGDFAEEIKREDYNDETKDSEEALEVEEDDPFWKWLPLYFLRRKYKFYGNSH